MRIYRSLDSKLVPSLYRRNQLDVASERSASVSWVFGERLSVLPTALERA
jgi:hypothetical protein